jgi:integrase
MSGRARDPERTSLHVDEWPRADAERWRAACAPGSLLDDEVGARSNHSAASNQFDQKGYGRWLCHLTVRDPDALALPAAERITAERVKAFVARLDDLGVSTGTILNLLQGLGAVAKVVGPDRDAIAVVNGVAARVRARHKPARDKTCRHLSDELFDLGIELMKGAPDRQRDFEAAIQYRDGLMISLLALVPLRRRNLAGLVLGRSLVRQGQRYIIAFAEGETKTGAALELLWPDMLVEALGRYLDVWRPILARRTGRWTRDLAGALWVGKDGSGMTEIAIYDRICARTREAFGEAINPHAFRHAAATTQAIADPGRVRIAAPLLGHRTFTTTQRYYEQANAHVAQRSFLEIIEELREAARDP